MTIIDLLKLFSFFKRRTTRVVHNTIKIFFSLVR